MRKTDRKSLGNREWVSIVEVMSATGEILKCPVLFMGKNLQTSWFPDQPPDWLYTTSENGWTSNAIYSEQLKQ